MTTGRSRTGYLATILQAMFPQVKFIILFCHPVPVSLANQKKFAPQSSLYSLVQHWVVCHRSWEEDKRCIRNFLELRHEGLVSEPGREIGRIQAFLGANAQWEAPPIIKRGQDERYFSAWHSGKTSALRAPYIRFMSGGLRGACSASATASPSLGWLGK